MAEQLRTKITADASGFVRGVNQAAAASNKFTKANRKSSQAFTQVAYALDDAQYGFRGVQNNLQAIAVTAGASGPVVLGITAMAVALNFFLDKAAASEEAVWNFGNEVKKLTGDLESLNAQVNPDTRTLEDRIADKWDDILEKQAKYAGFILGLQNAADIAGFGGLFEAGRNFFGLGDEDLLDPIGKGNKQKSKDTKAARDKKATEDRIKANDKYYRQFMANTNHMIALNKIYGDSQAELAQKEWEMLQTIDRSKLTEEQNDALNKRMEILYAYMGVLDEVVVTGKKANKELSAADQILNQGIANMISGFAEAVGSGQDFGKALLGGIGRILVQLGGLLIVTGLGIEAFKESLKTLSGPVAIAAGVAMVAAGAAFSAAANKAGGGSGRRTVSASGSAGGGRAVNTSSDTGNNANVTFTIKGQDLVGALDYNRNVRNSYIPS